MTAYPVFIAALPREIAPLIKRLGLRAEPDLLARGIHLYGYSDAVFACAGMGAHRASLAVEAVLARCEASRLVSVGWAGACDAAMAAGQIVRVTTVVDVKTGERYFAEPEKRETAEPRTLVTVAAPASRLEKQRLHLSYQAAAVDMEAATVARIARARALPFYAIKAISDAADFELPAIGRFVTPKGSLREAAFGLHVALHPSLWRPVATLARSSTLAAEHLCTEIEDHIRSSGN